MSKDILLITINVPEPIKENKTIKNIIKENSDTEKILRDIRTIFDKIHKDIRTLFEPEEDYYKPIKTVNAFDDNQVEYQSNGDKDKPLPIKEHLDKI